MLTFGDNSLGQLGWAADRDEGQNRSRAASWAVCDADRQASECPEHHSRPVTLHYNAHKRTGDVLLAASSSIGMVVALLSHWALHTSVKVLAP